MKLRNGFVSNSSSSSFIVAVKDATKIQLVIEADLEKFADKIITTEEELNKHFEYEWGDEFKDKDEWVMKTYNKCLKAINDGMKVLFGSFSSDGEALEQFLCEEGVPDSPGIDVIQGDGGY